MAFKKISANLEFMKELILFSFVILFIACQNQPLPETKLETTTHTEQHLPALTQVSVMISESCQNTQVEETAALDLTKELEHPTQPGIYYRQAQLRSEAIDSSELLCLSQVTASLEEDKIESPAATSEPAEAKQDISWDVLTKKWAITAQALSCQDHNAQSTNPSCQETSFMTEQGQFFSSDLITAL